MTRPLIMTRPFTITPLYSMKIFTVKTFANCPETAKFVKVFTCEGFPLYGRVWEFVAGINFCDFVSISLQGLVSS